MSNLPRIKGYSLWLNSGFNIDAIRDSSDKFGYGYERYYNGEKSYETLQYFLPASDNKTRFLPKKFRIKYVGAFPVKADTSKYNDRGDWKGNVAINDKYLRLTEQSAWYPILYDTLKDVQYQKVTYDLKIITDSKAIFLNGSPPVQASTANFKSDVPVPLLLLAGDFDFSKNMNTYFVNTFLDKKQQDVLSGWSNKITNFYLEKLKIPYGSAITYVGATAVSRKNAWLFVTYPTVAFIANHDGYSIKSYFNDKQQLKDSSLVAFFSHELGHYYFGTYLVPNAELRWMFLEGFTEYISLKARQQILGDKFYSNSLANYVKKLKNFEATPISSIKNENDISDVYRYNYIPLLLTALEKQIGEINMWKWLNIVLNSKDVNTNYAFFKSSLIQSGITSQQYKTFEDRYIISANAKQNVLDDIK
ncbi:hypothetical protein ACFGVR_19310 [Mucilaginibacter sp. AW1-3]